MIPTNLADDLYIQSLHNAAVIADGNSAAIDLVAYEGEVAIVLNVQNPAAGTNPTLAIKLQECDTAAGSYTDVSGGGFTSYTDTGSQQILRVVRHNLKRFVELNFDIGGTMSPSYAVSASVIGMKKYQ